MAIPLPTAVIEAARNGDALHIEALIEVVWPDAYRLARAILGEDQPAQDAAQEACIILYRTIASLRNAAAFRTWFYRIVVREASDLKRRRSGNEEIELKQQAADPTAVLDVWRALASLPQHLRDVVVLRYFEDLSSREIAQVLRIPDGTVRFRLMIAKRRLRPLLGEIDPLSPATGKANVNAI
jgi:RNA polymerase sigma-70 factor (ECF subfamily)